MCPAQLRARVLMPDRDPASFSRENTTSRASYDFPFSRISSGYEIMMPNNNITIEIYIIHIHICQERLLFIIIFCDILYHIFL